MKIKNTNKYDQLIIYGAGQYFLERARKILQLNNRTMVFDNRLSSMPSAISAHQWINSLDNIPPGKTLYLIARYLDQDITEAKAHIHSVHPDAEVDHVQFYTEKSINASYINSLGLNHYEDQHGNTINIAKINGFCSISFQGEHSSITLNDNIEINNRLNIVVNGDRGTLNIGKSTTFVETYIEIGSDGIVTIGEDCMFSYDVKIYQSDQHLIFDKISGKRLNLNKHIFISNHVWVGRSVTLLGGLSLGNGSIIGTRSISSGKFGNNKIIAGAPAKVIRDNIVWDRRHTKDSHNITHISQLKT